MKRFCKYFVVALLLSSYPITTALAETSASSTVVARAESTNSIVVSPATETQKEVTDINFNNVTSELNLNVSQRVDLYENSNVLFSFTPAESGLYAFKSSSDYDFDAFGELFDSNGNIITNDDDGSGNLQFFIVAQLNANEVYYLNASSYYQHYHNEDVEGAFEVTVSKFEVTSDLVLNTPKDISLVVGQDVWHKFIPSESGLYIFESQSNSGFDPYARLYGANGDLISYDDDSAGNLQFSIVSHLNAGEVYYLSIRAYSHDIYQGITGNFSIAVSNVPALDLTLDTVQDITLAENQQSWHKFIPNESGPYIFESLSESGFDTYASLYDASGNLVDYDDDSAGNLQFSMIPYLNAGEIYYLNTRSYSNELAGSFSIAVSKKPVLELTLDTIHDVDLTHGQQSWYRFVPSESGLHTFESFGNSSDPFGELYDSNGNMIAYNDDNTGSLQFLITHYLVAGEAYYLNTRDFYGEDASFSIKVTNIKSQITDLDTLVSNVPQYVDLNNTGRWFKFTPTETGSYSFSSSSDTSFDAYAELYDSDGNMIAYDDDSADNLQFVIIANMIAGETYYLRVAGYGDNTWASNIPATTLASMLEVTLT